MCLLLGKQKVNAQQKDKMCSQKTRNFLRQIKKQMQLTQDEIKQDEIKPSLKICLFVNTISDMIGMESDSIAAQRV